jgi:hypothetical protein
MKSFYLSITLFFILISNSIFSQVFSEEDISIFNDKIKFAKNNNLKDLSLNEIIASIGKSFISTPYLAHSLEVTDKEELVINFKGLDCTTFLETTFALALCIKNNKTDFEDFISYLKKIRYREEKIEDYTSRLHYFSDWIYHNERKNLIKDVTKNLGGIQKNFDLNFMSTNPHLYKHLKNNPDYVPIINKQERDISSRQYFYIPANRISNISNQIKSGDFIALVSNQKGLDIGHVGIAIKNENGKIHFLHAPQVGSYVQITSEPLHEYVRKIKKHIGIIILRAVE